MDYDKLPTRGKECSDGEKTRNCGCGARAYVFYNENAKYNVECEKCGELVSFKTLSHDMAIKMWNDMPTSIGRTTLGDRKQKMVYVEENYYEELKANSDKLIEKETPIKPNTSEGHYNYCPKCNGFVEDDYGRTFDYCPHCGKRLDNSNV